ncbi:S41 family peptidase [Cocleimonas flava]|uniref:Peptidase S41-like protein n=1 Tax=Cocleimonas flava TaxID=634765 RepID=A0A4R1F2M2_9GAMM|nr:S41 family peptidase [Cocleimonas flava]TCJ86782.1 peptidase S41-like protein [Cocleimonas flava]
MSKDIFKTIRLNVLLFLVSFSVIACGGGSSTDLASGSGSSSSSSTSGGSGVSLISTDNITWQKGIYNSSGEFAGLCEIPREELDLVSQQTLYPDVLGSLNDEKNWLRSWSDENYLWYNEIEDMNPALFSTPLEYFDQLKTFETISSGKQKDRFHFTQNTDVFLDEAETGLTIGYGFTVVLTSNQVPREAVIAYTQPNTVATSDTINLKRGDKILAVDGIDIINTSSDDLSLANAYLGLFPEEVGKSHTFTIQEKNSNTIREISLTSAYVTLQSVQNNKIIETAEGKIGYFLFNEHIETAESQLIEAMSIFHSEGISDLVLDIRYNGGGLIDIANGLASMISSTEKTNNTTFSIPTFNDKHPDINPFTGEEITGTNFYQTSSEDFTLPHLNLSRVFVLTGEATCSASELIINGLIGIDVEVIQIGSSTCGKPHGFYPTDNCGTTYFSINFKSENNKGFAEFDDGFAPIDNTSSVGAVLLSGCSIPDDFTKDLGDPEESRLAAAIFYKENGECPDITLSRQSKLIKKNEIPFKPSWLNNAIGTIRR